MTEKHKRDNDTKLRNFRIPQNSSLRGFEKAEAISRNSKFLLAFGLDKSSPARKFYKGYALNL